MSTLGVVILNLSGMKHLARCLESVRWADAVTILHLGDGEPVLDQAPALAQRMHIQRIVSLKDAKGPSSNLQTDWILHLWGDEEVGAELKGELCALGCSEGGRVPSSYRIPIRSFLLGCWVEGSLWGPSPSPRLWSAAHDLACGWWGIRERVSEEPSGSLRGWIRDHSSTELRDGLDRVNRLSDLWVEQWRTRDQVPSFGALALRPLRVFMRVLLRNGFFSAGLAGLTLSALAAYAALLSGAKLWEAGNVRSEKTA